MMFTNNCFLTRDLSQEYLVLWNKTLQNKVVSGKQPDIRIDKYAFIRTNKVKINATKVMHSIMLMKRVFRIMQLLNTFYSEIFKIYIDLIHQL